MHCAETVAKEGNRYSFNRFNIIIKGKDTAITGIIYFFRGRDTAVTGITYSLKERKQL